MLIVGPFPEEVDLATSSLKGAGSNLRTADLSRAGAHGALHGRLTICVAPAGIPADRDLASHEAADVEAPTPVRAAALGVAHVDQLGLRDGLSGILHIHLRLDCVE